MKKQILKKQNVVDLGCGKAHLSEYYKKDPRFNFTNIDHISTNSHIIQGDISQLPLDDHSQEMAILCLAMWGSNCKEYLREAHRVLETHGNLYMVEATKRWTTEGESPASRLKDVLRENGFMIVEEIIEKFCYFTPVNN